MASGMVYGNSKMAVLLQSERLPCSSEVLESLWIPSASHTFPGPSSVVSFDDAGGRDTGERLFFQQLSKEENTEEDCDECFRQPEKKRRLAAQQVQYLEKSFEVENKLEPERKVQLAKELGLQPRQVAIWFQNRRARFKTKQLEKDYDSLKSSYDTLQADYENLLKEKEKMRTEVLRLTDKLRLREREIKFTELKNPVDSSNDQEPQNPVPSTGSENVAMVVCKQEDASSAKSDVFDSDSPHCTDGNHSSMLEPADSSHEFEQDHSDSSQDEEEDFSERLLPPPCFPKLEYGSYHDAAENGCNFGFTVYDQPFSFWPY